MRVSARNRGCSNLRAVHTALPSTRDTMFTGMQSQCNPRYSLACCCLIFDDDYLRFLSVIIIANFEAKQSSFSGTAQKITLYPIFAYFLREVSSGSVVLENNSANVGDKSWEVASVFLLHIVSLFPRSMLHGEDPRILNSPWPHMSHEIKRFRGTTWSGNALQLSEHRQRY